MFIINFHTFYLYNYWISFNAAMHLGLPFVHPYLDLTNHQRNKIRTGINYASGGSGILPDTNNVSKCHTHTYVWNYFISSGIFFLFLSFVFDIIYLYICMYYFWRWRLWRLISKLSSSIGLLSIICIRCSMRKKKWRSIYLNPCFLSLRGWMITSIMGPSAATKTFLYSCLMNSPYASRYIIYMWHIVEF